MWCGVEIIFKIPIQFTQHASNDALKKYLMRSYLLCDRNHWVLKKVCSYDLEMRSNDWITVFVHDCVHCARFYSGAVKFGCLGRYLSRISQ